MVSNSECDRKVTKKSLYNKHFKQKKCIFLKKNHFFIILSTF